MKRFFAGSIALFLPVLAQAQAAAEPPIESNPAGTIAFIVLFVGFCVVFVWMVWRNKDKEKKDQAHRH